MTKKIIFFLGILGVMFSVKAKVYEGKFESLVLIPDVFAMKINENGKITYKKGWMKFESNTGNFIYCIDPFVTIKNDKPYEEYDDNFLDYIDMDEKTWQKINLYSYYGYKYQDESYDHTADYWYYITQILIWRAVAPKAQFYFTDTYKGDKSETKFQQEIAELESLVASHFVTPSFNLPEYILENETISLSDNASVLKNFELDKNPNITIANNNIIVKSWDKPISFTLSKKMKDTGAHLYISSESQNILMGSETYDVKKSYQIKVKPRLGNIILQKYIEDKDYSNNTYTYKYIPYADIEFNLYDESNQLLSTKKTNTSGIIEFTNLLPGKYYLEEVTTLPEYQKIDKQIVNLSLDEQTREVKDEHITIYNDLKKKSIKIKKVDSHTLEGIANTFLKIYDTKDNLIYEGFTDELGFIYIDSLPLNKYYIKEVIANDDYLLTDEIFYFEVSDDKDIIEVIIKNEKKPDEPVEPPEEPTPPVEPPIIEIEIPNTGTINNSILLYWEDEKYKLNKLVNFKIA